MSYMADYRYCMECYKAHIEDICDDLLMGDRRVDVSIKTVPDDECEECAEEDDLLI